jgi:hypothetical protein
MKVLEPMDDVPQLEIHPQSSKYEELYQRILKLNGKVLPIQFDSTIEALHFGASLRAKGSRARRLGIKAQQRGDKVYLQKS